MGRWWSGRNTAASPSYGWFQWFQAICGEVRSKTRSGAYFGSVSTSSDCFSVQGTIVWLWLPCLRLKSMLPPTVAVKLRLCSISRSLAGHDGMCLVGVCNFQARRVFIHRDPAIPPKTEILGPLSVGWLPVFKSSKQWCCFSCENQDGHRWPGFASLSWPMAVKVRCGLLFLVIH